MNFLPDELSRRVWNYLYPTDKIVNGKINNKQTGTSVNNIFQHYNYCINCGEINKINKCIYCNQIVYSLCVKCKHVSFEYDMYCIDEYRDYLV
jgi:hypothetical protein